MTKPISKIELIKKLQQLKKELGRVPYSEEMDKAKYFPHSSTYFTHFGSWNQALLEANLEPNKIQKYNDEYIEKLFISFIKNYHKRYHKLPSKSILSKQKDLPDPGTIDRRYGSYGKFLEKSGLAVLPQKPEWIYSDEQLVSFVKEAAVILDKSPSCKDMDKIEGFPSCATYLRRFGTWNNTLKNCDLDLNRYDGISNDELIEILQQTAQLIGRTPSQTEFGYLKGVPSAGLYFLRFGSWLNAIDKAGLDMREHKVWMRWEYLCYKIAKAIYGDKNVRRGKVKGIKGIPDFHIPTKKLIIDAMTVGYIHERKKSAVERYIIPDHKLEFWCILKGYEYQHPRLRYRYLNELREEMEHIGRLDIVRELNKKMVSRMGFFNKKEIINSLKELSQKLGRRPKQIDVDRSQTLPSCPAIANKFGSFTNALIAAGITPYREYLSDNELLTKLRKAAKIYGRTPSAKEMDKLKKFPTSNCYLSRFGTWNNAIIKAGLIVNIRYDYSKSELIEILRAMARELGRVPMQKDINENKNIPSSGPFQSIFGSFSEALREAGLKPNRRRWSRGLIIKALRKYKKEHDKIPSAIMVDKDKAYPDSTTCIRHFGSWNEALRRAGFNRK